MKFLLLLERSLLLVFWVLLIFGFDLPYTAILTILAALIHELGHVFCLMRTKSSCNLLPKPNVSGFRIKIPEMSYQKELLCALYGPLANLAVALLCLLPLSPKLTPYLHTFATLNIMTMISNLLPIEEYDGYKILGSVLSLTVRCEATAQNVLYMTSLIFSAVMCFLSLYVMLKLGEGYWIFAVFFTVMIRMVIKKQKACIF